jgi:hypothetical protein
VYCRLKRSYVLRTTSIRCNIRSNETALLSQYNRQCLHVDAELAHLVQRQLLRVHHVDLLDQHAELAQPVHGLAVCQPRIVLMHLHTQIKLSPWQNQRRDVERTTRRVASQRCSDKRTVQEICCTGTGIAGNIFGSPLLPRP